jgi:hypothetical protein
MSVASAGTVLKRPATSENHEKLSAANWGRLSVTAGCSRNLMESLNQRRPSLQRLHTPFRGSNRFREDMCSSNCSNSHSVQDSILQDEFTAMQDRKLWEKLLRFIDEISTSIQNEDLDQLHKILRFDQGNLAQSPTRFFRSETSVGRDVYLGSGFGGSQDSDVEFTRSPHANHFNEFRQTLGEIFHFFESYFPAVRWDFKKQLEEEEAIQRLLELHGQKTEPKKIVHEEHVLEVQPVKLNARQLLQMKVEAERIERAENKRLLHEGKVTSIPQTPLQLRCSEFIAAHE